MCPLPSVRMARPRQRSIISSDASISRIQSLLLSPYIQGESLASLAKHDDGNGEVILTTSARAVKTDEGNAAARIFGLPEAFTTVDDSVTGLLSKVCRDMIPK